MRISQKYRVSHLMGSIYRQLFRQKSLIGLKIGYFGRYQKKLRNKKV